MQKKEYGQICDYIIKISPYIRFVGVIDKNGKLLAYNRREGLEPLLDTKNTSYQFSHIAIKSELESYFDEQLGETEFAWEERKKVQTISFALDKTRVWVSIDKKVVRSEILCIADACLPIVKRYS
ncbi:MAG: hypothetical protein WD154_02050 [Nitrosopumilaceae archaeon]